MFSLEVMENGVRSAVPMKKSSYGPKKVFLSRLSVDSDSSSSLSSDRGKETKNQSVDRQNDSKKNHNEDRGHHLGKHHMMEENYSLKKTNEHTRRKSVDKKSSQDKEKTSAKINCFNTQTSDGKNSSSRGQVLAGNEQLTKNPPYFSQIRQSCESKSSSSQDLFAGSIHSSISLPDDLRLSFSEIEEGSLQLDDLDLAYSPADGSSSGNLANIAQEKCLEQDGDLQRIASTISSTSEQHVSEKQITEMSKLSEDFMTNQGQLASKVQNSTVKSEVHNSNENITWDDIVAWGVNGHQVSTY